MTTAAVVAYHRQEREVRISYAGHPPVLYKGVSDNAWSFVRPEKRQGPSDSFPLNLPLATDLDTRYTQLTIQMGSGDRFFVYTDGITDAPNSEGKPFRLSRLKDVLDENSDVPLSGLKSAVLKRLNQYTENQLNHDDVTLIALEIH